MQACPDSLTTFAAVAGDLAKVFSRSVASDRTASPASPLTAFASPVHLRPNPDDSADGASSSESGSRDMTGQSSSLPFSSVKRSSWLTSPRLAWPTPPPQLAGSIEEQAFHRQPTLITDADLVEDDVPRNTDYLDDHHGGRTPAPEPLSAFETVSLDPLPLAAQVVAETDGETVKLLDAAGILPVEDFIAATSYRTPETPCVLSSVPLRRRATSASC